jgi:hypothetical protein
VKHENFSAGHGGGVDDPDCGGRGGELAGAFPGGGGRSAVAACQHRRPAGENQRLLMGALMTGQPGQTSQLIAFTNDFFQPQGDDR